MNAEVEAIEGSAERLGEACPRGPGVLLLGLSQLDGSTRNFKSLLFCLLEAILDQHMYYGLRTAVQRIYAPKVIKSRFSDQLADVIW